MICNVEFDEPCAVADALNFGSERGKQSCHKQPSGPLTTGSAQVAGADTELRHLCVL